jgi:hypothetical protein
MVLPIVTRNKHRAVRRCRHHSRRRPAFGDGSGTGITGFAPASEHNYISPCLSKPGVATILPGAGSGGVKAPSGNRFERELIADRLGQHPQMRKAADKQIVNPNS